LLEAITGLVVWIEAEYVLIMGSSCSVEKRLLYMYIIFYSKKDFEACYELTIAESKAWYQIVLIKPRERSPYNGYGLLIWVRSVPNCVQAPVVEGHFA
jgi:hypothetical protein